MAKKWWTGEGVGSGENPLGVVTETANGTERNGAGSDGGNGYYWQDTPADQQSNIRSGRNSVQPPAPPPDPFVMPAPARRRR